MEHSQKIVSRLLQKLGSDVEFKIELVDEVIKAKNRKTPFLVQKLEVVKKHDIRT